MGLAQDLAADLAVGMGDGVEVDVPQGGQEQIGLLFVQSGAAAKVNSNMQISSRRIARLRTMI